MKRNDCNSLNNSYIINPRMVLGFIIIRHVNNKITDYYWKECYTCIRKFYDNPIMIIDDSSKKEFVNENIVLTNCTVIYDYENKGVAELLPYYYFHKLKPFDTAVIIHDSVFIQKHIAFDLEENETVRFLWTFQRHWDNGVFHLIDELCMDVFHYYELMELYNTQDWQGSFGVMSVMRWDFLDKINRKHKMFDTMLFKIRSRDHRSALERVIALLCYYNNPNIKNSIFGNIHDYIRWGTSFTEYLTKDMSAYPIVKVWSGR